METPALPKPPNRSPGHPLLKPGEQRTWQVALRRHGLRGRGQPDVGEAGGLQQGMWVIHFFRRQAVGRGHGSRASGLGHGNFFPCYKDPFSGEREGPKQHTLMSGTLSLEAAHHDLPPQPRWLSQPKPATSRSWLSAYPSTHQGVQAQAPYNFRRK